MARVFSRKSEETNRATQSRMGTVRTVGVLRAIAAAGHAPQEFLDRHAEGDWGELDEEDRRENERSLKR